MGVGEVQGLACRGGGPGRGPVQGGPGKFRKGGVGASGANIQNFVQEVPVTQMAGYPLSVPARDFKMVGGAVLGVNIRCP